MGRYVENEEKWRKSADRVDQFAFSHVCNARSDILDNYIPEYTKM